MKLAFVLLFAACALHAQVATSRLEGVVDDSSGAALPGATVVAVHSKTQTRVSAVTSALGAYVFPSLAPGDYTVSAEAAGFRKALHTQVTLNVAGVVTENFKLEVGAVTESVVVESNAVRVQVSESQISRAVTLRDIDVLPQLGRSPINLAIFQPGIQIDGGDVTASRVNGQRQGSNNAKLDGIDVNDSVVPRLGLSLTSNNTDTVGEFRIVTSGGGAEYGRNSGAQVEMITRTGSNDIHGEAFEYLRNTKLNSNNFFNNSSGVARPTFIQNIFGGSFGGPVRRNRTFVFGNFQGRRTAQTTVRNRTVLTPEVKAGLFRWRAPNSTAVQTFDIFRNDPLGKGLDPKMAEVLKLLPNPNNTDVGDIYNTAGFRFNNPSGSHDNQFTIRADHNLTSTHRLFYRQSWQRNASIDALNNADARYPGQEQGRQGGTRWGYSIGSDWVIAPNVVNEARLGRQNATVDFLRPARPKGPALLSNSFTDPIHPGFSQGRNSPVNDFTDNLSWIRGKHLFKAGTNIRLTTQFGYDDAGIYPNVSFARANGNSPLSTIGPNGAAVIGSADRQRFEEIYNDLLGRMNQVTQTFYSDLQKFQGPGTPRVRNYLLREYGFFFQDAWKVRPNLTLNVGLRYELNSVPRESNGLQGTVDKNAQVNLSANISDITMQRSGNWYNNDLNNFAPRAGFSWDVTGDGKTAIRANYGLYYDRQIGATVSYVDSNTTGFSQAVPVFPNSTGTADIRAGAGIPLPAQPSAPVLLLPAQRSTSISLFHPNLRTGYVHQYSLNIQREILRNTVVEAGYVGARGVKLFMDLNANQRKIGGDFLQAFREIQNFRASGTPVPASNTFVRLFGSVANAVSAIGGTTFDQGLAGTAADTLDRNNYQRYGAAGVSPFYVRNFPQFNQLIWGTNSGRNYYDSLQISVRRQTGALKVNANYTFSKSIDNISVDGNGFTAPIDSYNIRLNRARGDADRPHSFNSSLIYTLPIGRGHFLLGKAPRWVDTLAGGWDVGVLTIWQNGAPFTATSGRATTGSSANSWANYTGDRTIGSISRQGGGVFYFTPEQIARFSFPGAGEIGTSGRNAFRAPRFFNTDLSLVKNFKLNERHVVTYRAEFYRLPNNVNFASPGLSLVTPAAFGKISSTIGQPRIMQMALRYHF